MAQKFWHVDAFTTDMFSGNPASVTLLDRPLCDLSWGQRAAGEISLPMNSFVWRINDDSSGENPNQFAARLFTTTNEIPVSGHGILSTCHVLWEAGEADHTLPIKIATQDGLVEANLSDGAISLRMRAFQTSDEVENSEAVCRAIGLMNVVSAHSIISTNQNAEFLIVLKNEKDVSDYSPDFDAIREHMGRGLVITACADNPDYDFVSRFFAPRYGLDEDWTTGITHCALFPFWGRIMKKKQMTGKQVSRRPGKMTGVLEDNDWLTLFGRAVTVLHGNIYAAPNSD